MNIVNVTKASTKLYKYIDEATGAHELIVTTRARSNAISETLYLLSVPNMRGSIEEGLSANV